MFSYGYENLSGRHMLIFTTHNDGVEGLRCAVVKAQQLCTVESPRVANVYMPSFTYISFVVEGLSGGLV